MFKTYKQFLLEDTEDDILVGMETYERENKPIYNVDVFNNNDGSIAVVLRRPTTYKKTGKQFRERYMDTQGWYSSNGEPTFTKFVPFKYTWRYFTTNKENLDNVVSKLYKDAQDRDIHLSVYNENK